MSTISIRRPAVAGRFYPSGKQELSELIKEIHQKEKAKIDLGLSQKEIYGAVVPHAGYIFSAYQAVHFFEILKNSEKKFDTFVIINPNHTGYGEKIALDSHTHWQTPFGNIEQDMEFLVDLNLPFSNIAHESEHSGEVMLPLLQQFISNPFKIAVITLSQQNPEQARILAEKIRNSGEKFKRKIAIIASSDFTHFKNSQQGFELDELVLEQIKYQDNDKLYNIVKENDISVCGYGPIMCLMEYSRLFGAYSSSILARGHSGEIIPSEKVVDYISILFYKKVQE
jgi:AmmeMemoRadiSam system protein B